MFKRKVRKEKQSEVEQVGLRMAIRAKWEKVAGVKAARDDGERKTTATPLGMSSIFAPFRTSGVQNALPKPTAANLRRFAETPAARRAINFIHSGGG